MATFKDNPFRSPDDVVKAVEDIIMGRDRIAETNKNDKSDDGDGLDAVQPKAVKKKFKDRKDKDIDNDGDVDGSDKYLHKKRKAISKAVKEREDEKEEAKEHKGDKPHKHPHEEDKKSQKEDEEPDDDEEDDDDDDDDDEEDEKKKKTLADTKKDKVKVNPEEPKNKDTASEEVKHGTSIRKVLEIIRSK